MGVLFEESISPDRNSMRALTSHIMHARCHARVVGLRRLSQLEWCEYALVRMYTSRVTSSADLQEDVVDIDDAYMQLCARDLLANDNIGELDSELRVPIGLCMYVGGEQVISPGWAL